MSPCVSWDGEHSSQLAWKRTLQYLNHPSRKEFLSLTSQDLFRIMVLPQLHRSLSPQLDLWEQVYNTNQIPKPFIKNVPREIHLTWRAMSVIVFLSTPPTQLSFEPTSTQGALWACFSVFRAEVQMLILPSRLKKKNYPKLRVTKSD